jgi:hypothetical protein
VKLPAFVTRIPRAWAITVGTLFVAYTLGGFLLAPVLVRNAIQDGARRGLTRQPTIERVRVNPLALSLSLKGIAIHDSTGDTLVSCRSFYVRFNLLSPFYGAWTLAALHLDAPGASVEILADSSLNLARLLRAPADTTHRDQKPPAVLIQDLRLDDGWLRFANRTRTPVFRHRFHPVQLALKDFTTKKGRDNAYSFAARSQADEQLAWQGTFELDPPRSEGRFRIDGLRAQTLDRLMAGQLPFRLTRGTMGLGARYTFDALAGHGAVRLSDLGLRVSDLALADTSSGDEVVAVTGLEAQSGTVEPGRLRLSLGKVTTTGGRFLSVLKANGHPLMESWSSPPVPGAPPPWTIEIPELRCSGYRVVQVDRRLSPPAKLEFRDLSFDADSFSTAKGARIPIAVACNLSSAGTASAKGAIVLDPMAVDLQVEARGFELSELQPYAGLYTHLVLVSGRAFASGRLRMAAPGSREPQMRFDGDATVGDFDCQDSKLHQDVLKWQALSLKGLRWQSMPSRTEVKEVALLRPYLRATVGPDRVANLQTLAIPPDSLPAVFRSAAPDSGPVRIDRIAVHDGTMDFADLSLKPTFATGIQKLEGSIRELSSEDAEHGVIELDGEVSSDSPVKVSGTINPLSDHGRTDVSLSFKNIELTTFTPYSGRFMGYRIEKGKLSLDLNYKVTGRELQGANKVFLNQFTLGDKVESAEATKLPVRFALALLKDSQGNIDLDIPVHGNLDDPKFSVGRIILKILINLVVKAVSSPFKLLGALVGGGGDADYSAVDFAAGSAVLAESQGARVDKLGSALADRPGLQLEIHETVDAAQDSLAILEQRFRDALMVARRAEAKRGQPVDTTATLDPASYARVLSAAYEARFGPAPPSPLAKKPKGKALPDSLALAAEAARVQSMEARVRSSILVTSADLAQLGQARASAVKERVLRNPKVSTERVFVVERGISRQQQAAEESWRGSVEVDSTEVAPTPTAAPPAGTVRLHMTLAGG